MVKTAQDITTDTINYTNSIVSRLCNRYDIPPWEKEELAAIARLNLVRIARKYRPDKGMAWKSYLWLRIEGVVKDYVRTAMRTRCVVKKPTFVSLESLPEKELEKALATNGTLNKVIAQDLVQKILSRLPANYGQVLRLYYLEELEMKEIAELKGCSESAVSFLCKAARTRARAEYALLTTEG